MGIVTGGVGGIGRAISDLFAKQGAEIVVADIVRESAVRVAAEIENQKGRAFPLVVDVTKQDSVRQMVQAVLDRCGRIDILVNVAGGAIRKLVLETDETEWDQVIDLNLKSVFLCSQAVLPAMIRQHYGKIVSISSIYGFTGSMTRAHYAAAKAGVVAFTRSLALEVAKHGIMVNAIAPGLTSTERVRGRYSDEEWQKQVSTFPMGRAALPQEIARATLFLVQDETSCVTGQTIHVNGGCAIW